MQTRLHPVYGRATLDERIAHAQNKLLGVCKHFNGISHRVCLAGIRYWSVGPQPCMQEYDTGKHVCPLREFPTPEAAHAEAAVREQHIDEAMKRWNDRRVNHECLDCGVPYERLRQVGPCVYAEPCGHQQYQGRLPKEESTHGS